MYGKVYIIIKYFAVQFELDRKESVNVAKTQLPYCNVWQNNTAFVIANI